MKSIFSFALILLLLFIHIPTAHAVGELSASEPTLASLSSPLVSDEELAILMTRENYVAEDSAVPRVLNPESENVIRLVRAWIGDSDSFPSLATLLTRVESYDPTRRTYCDFFVFPKQGTESSVSYVLHLEGSRNTGYSVMCKETTDQFTGIGTYALTHTPSAGGIPYTVSDALLYLTQDGSYLLYFLTDIGPEVLVTGRRAPFSESQLIAYRNAYTLFSAQHPSEVMPFEDYIDHNAPDEKNQRPIPYMDQGVVTHLLPPTESYESPLPMVIFLTVLSTALLMGGVMAVIGFWKHQRRHPRNGR